MKALPVVTGAASRIARGITSPTSSRIQRAVAATFVASAASIAIALASPASAVERPTEPIALGRYLVQAAGCNDCHTPGYGATAGKTPEAQWLTGDQLGWQGPWGTTYPTNLRQHFAGLTEEQWMSYARTGESRPPMPWFNLRTMADEELKAIYRYIKAAGPAGQPAPKYVPPGGKAAGPVVVFPGN
jgi:mono/diheme cytochrome c family protein